MQVPVIRGVIDRRILVNFRVAPEVIQRHLPSPLRPKLVNSHAIAGICLIRLREIRPRFVPRQLGIASENAAHRIAVQWSDKHEGVFVPRRDTSSRLNALAGGRLFPGVHHLADFQVLESQDSFAVTVVAPGHATLLQIRATVSTAMPSTSIFASIDDASTFFERGSVGFSPSRTPSQLDGLELRSKSWLIEPLQTHEVHSRWLSDTNAFPRGSVEFDSAFLMRNIDHEWHAHKALSCGVGGATPNPSLQRTTPR